MLTGLCGRAMGVPANIDLHLVVHARATALNPHTFAKGESEYRWEMLCCTWDAPRRARLSVLAVTLTCVCACCASCCRRQHAQRIHADGGAPRHDAGPARHAGWSGGA